MAFLILKYLLVMTNFLLLTYVLILTADHYFSHSDRTSWGFIFHLLTLCWLVMRGAFWLSTVLPIVHWTTLSFYMLYWMPAPIEFAAFMLLPLYFAQILYPQEWKKHWEHVRPYYFGFIVGIIAFQLVWTWVAASPVEQRCADAADDYNESKCFRTEYRSDVFRIVSCLCFILLATMQIIFGFQVLKLDPQRFAQYFTTTPKVISQVNALLAISFTTRSLYQLLAVSSSYTLANIPIEANDGDVDLIVFILFEFWVYFPTIIIVGAITSQRIDTFFWQRLTTNAAHVTGYGAVSSESAMAVINGVHAADLEENVEMRLIREEDSTRERRSSDIVPIFHSGRGDIGGEETTHLLQPSLSSRQSSFGRTPSCFGESTASRYSRSGGSIYGGSLDAGHDSHPDRSMSLVEFDRRKRQRSASLQSDASSDGLHQFNSAAAAAANYMQQSNLTSGLLGISAPLPLDTLSLNHTHSRSNSITSLTGGPSGSSHHSKRPHRYYNEAARSTSNPSSRRGSIHLHGQESASALNSRSNSMDYSPQTPSFAPPTHSEEAGRLSGGNAGLLSLPEREDVNEDNEDEGKEQEEPNTGLVTWPEREDGVNEKSDDEEQEQEEPVQVPATIPTTDVSAAEIMDTAKCSPTVASPQKQIPVSNAGFDEEVDGQYELQLEPSSLPRTSYFLERQHVQPPSTPYIASQAFDYESTGGDHLLNPVSQHQQSVVDVLPVAVQGTPSSALSASTTSSSASSPFPHLRGNQKNSQDPSHMAGPLPQGGATDAVSIRELVINDQQQVQRYDASTQASFPNPAASTGSVVRSPSVVSMGGEILEENSMESELNGSILRPLTQKVAQLSCAFNSSDMLVAEAGNVPDSTEITPVSSILAGPIVPSSTAETSSSINATGPIAVHPRPRMSLGAAAARILNHISSSENLSGSVVGLSASLGSNGSDSFLERSRGRGPTLSSQRSWSRNVSGSSTPLQQPPAHNMLLRPSSNPHLSRMLNSPSQQQAFQQYLQNCQQHQIEGDLSPQPLATQSYSGGAFFAPSPSTVANTSSSRLGRSFSGSGGPLVGTPERLEMAQEATRWRNEAANPIPRSGNPASNPAALPYAQSQLQPRPRHVPLPRNFLSMDEDGGNDNREGDDDGGYHQYDENGYAEDV